MMQQDLSKQGLNGRILKLRVLLAMSGIMLLMMSGILIFISVFGTFRFTVGIMLHLLGQILGISALCLPVWLSAWHNALDARHQIVSESAAPDGAVRPAQFHMGTQLMRILYGLALLGLFVYGSIANGIQFSHLLQLHRQGLTTNATITGTSFRDGKPLMNVTYSFTTDVGMPIVDSFKAPRRLIQDMRTGNAVPITYVPLHPEIHTWLPVDNGMIMRHVLSGMLLFITVLVYVGFPVIVMENRLRRQLRLARVGSVVTGTITNCKPLVWRGRRYGYWLTSLFILSNGDKHSSQAFVPHVPGEPTLPGFPITVLYDSIRPDTNLPLAALHGVRMTTLRKSILAMSKLFAP